MGSCKVFVGFSTGLWWGVGKDCFGCLGCLKDTSIPVRFYDAISSLEKGLGVQI